MVTLSDTLPFFVSVFVFSFHIPEFLRVNDSVGRQ